MNQLEKLARKYQTDKWSIGYTDYYSIWFEENRNNKLKVLEIGIQSGASIRMWEEYFPNSMIYGMDIPSPMLKGRQDGVALSNMESLKSSRIVPFYANQGDRNDLKKFIDECGGDFDIIIDDGSHFQDDQQISWGFLWQYLKPGGLYVIEDIAVPREFYKSREKDDRWGISDIEKFSDSTFNVILDFIENERLNSPYMTEKEQNHISDTVESNGNGKVIKIIQSGVTCFSSIKKMEII